MRRFSKFDFYLLGIITGILLALGLYLIINWSPREISQPETRLEECFVKAPNLPLIPHIQTLATVTAYNPTKEQCGQNPDIMASGKRVYEGSVACPRELEFGTVVRIDGKWYVCEDRTSKKYDGRFDLLMFSEKEAIEFGKQKKEVEIYK